MVAILLYCIGVMYTPGPVNILSLNSGARTGFTAHAPFCLGVGAALSLWFLVIGYTGRSVISDRALPGIAVVGICFTLYLAYKIMTSDVDAATSASEIVSLSFKDGLLMQLSNPKSFLAVLPVTTVQFPAVGIAGSGIAIWSVGLGLLGIGAPLSYAVLGSTMTARITSRRFFQCFNMIMGLMLIATAVDMGYHQVYLALR